MRSALLLSAAMLSSCLPEDTRDPPATVLLTVQGSPSTVDGFVSSDGWTVRFDRVLVTLGNGDLEGDLCSEYADADYTRVLDARLRAPQKLNLLYGVGTCELEIRARNPEPDSLLGEGVSEQDKTAMREPGSDPYEPFAGITYLVRGSAEKNGVRKSFDWKYRRRRVAYDECEVDGQKTVRLVSDQQRTIALFVHADVLFHDAPKNPRTRFEPYALADADSDAVITLEELAKTPLADVGITLPDVPEAAALKTLGDLLYFVQFPRIVRVGAEGTCSISFGRGGP